MDVNEELKFLRKFEKKSGGVGLGGVRVGTGGQEGGCERRIEVFGKIHKKNRGRGGEVGRERRGSGRGSGWWGVRVDVNAMLGVGGDMGYGNQE